MNKKNVVLLGDSIRLFGYGAALPAMLGEAYSVWQPEDNSRFVSYLLRQLFDHREEIEKADIVHFNTGEWDICELFGDGSFTPEETYVSQTLRIADLLLSRNRTVIFATTTPVKAENLYNRNETIRRFNGLIVPRLAEKGVLINDLYSAVAADIDRYISDDTIHLSEAGAALCAEQTARIIRAASV